MNQGFKKKVEFKMIPGKIPGNLMRHQDHGE